MKWPCFVAVAGMVAASAPRAAAEGLRIDHRPVRCVVAGKFPIVRASLEPGGDVQQAKVLFKAQGSLHWYAVPMKVEGPVYAGVLPRPKKSLKALTYYIEATDTKMNVTRTAESEPMVVSGPGACKDREMAGTLGSASVALEAPAGAPPVPAGFSAAGVVWIAAGATAPGAMAGSAAATGGGISSTALIAGGVAVAGATTAVVVATRGGSDCTPGGGVQFSVESPLEGGSWSCANPPSGEELFRIRNGSCTELRDVRLTFLLSEACPLGNAAPATGTEAMNIDAPPGAEIVLRRPIPRPLACGVTAGPCSREITYTLTTSVGTATDVVRYGLDRSTCPPCS